MRLSNYPNGFSGGVLIRNMPQSEAAPGRVLWVGNNATLLTDEKLAADNDLGGKGGSFLQPFATIDFAVGRCAANRGDVIFVRPGHVETISAASSLDLDVAGIKLVGLGHGSKQCRLDFTATAGTVTVDADDVQIVNMNFHANVSAVVIGLSVIAGATDCLVKNCRFDVEATTTDEFNRSINVGVGCGRIVIEDNIIDMGLGGAVAAIALVGATDDIVIQRNTIQGDYSTGNITSETTASTKVHILDNLLINGLSTNINSEPVLECTSLTTSGIVARNYIVADLATQAAATVGTDFVYFENFRSDEKGAGITGHTSSATIVISADG